MLVNTNPPIIAVTGTKGKTTTVAVLAQVLRRLDWNVLRVDTTGHYINSERKSNVEDSKRIWGLVPTIAPGRYLFEFMQETDAAHQSVAVLETSYGSGSASGLGYRAHRVGVFLNVFEDHLGSSKRLQTPEDMAAMKSFIFRQIDQEGYAVFNADDARVVGRVGDIPAKKGVRLVACGLTFNAITQDEVFARGGAIVTVEDGWAVVKVNEQERYPVVDVRLVAWTFDGKFTPSIYNLLHTIGAVFALYDGHMPEGLGEIIQSSYLDAKNGRLVLLQGKTGVRVLADYAHEAHSLQELATLARNLAGTNGKVLGVVRMPYDRTDKQLCETGAVIGRQFDTVIVYDKIDGHFRHPQARTSNPRFSQQVGYTSRVVFDAVKESNPHSERILREDQALVRAAELARSSDVVVHIVNDDIERSLEFIVKTFDVQPVA